MARSSKTEAEERYARAQKRVHEAAKAQTDAQTEAKRVNDNTQRLRALRLAREEAERVAAAAAPPPAKKKPKAAAKPKPRKSLVG